MPELRPHVPKHRQPAARRAPRTALRTLVVLSSLSVVGTGTAIATGTLSLSAPEGSTAAVATAAVAAAGRSVEAAPQLAGADVDQAADQARTDAVKAAAVDAARRGPVVSRSDRRGVADPAKEAALSLESDGNAMTRSEDLSDADPRTVARALLAQTGSSSQFGCLDSLWTRESGWSVTADNPYSSAYGIPQALPGSKMSAFGADWATNPVTQIRWGLDYIDDRYGSPCGAWAHSRSNGWY